MPSLASHEPGSSAGVHESGIQVPTKSDGIVNPASPNTSADRVEADSEPLELPSKYTPDDYPDGGFQAWIVLFSTWCGLFSTLGLLNCVGVFQQYYTEGPLSDYDQSVVAWIQSMQIWTMTFFSLLFGRLFDYYGPRWLLVIGSLVYVFGLMMMSLSHVFYQFFLSQGVVAGLGASAVFTAATSTVTSWFFRRRGTAFGIMASGSSFGGAVLPIMMNRLISSFGFPWAIRAVGFLFAALLTFMCIVVKTRLAPVPTPVALSDFTAMARDVPFVLTCSGSFLFYWGMFIPLNYIVVQAKQMGMDSQLVPYLLTVLNAVSIIGRIVPGLVGDKIGRYNTMIILVSISAVFTLALWAPGENTAAIIAFLVAFGLSSTGYNAVAPALIVQISDIRQIGIRTGMSFAVQSFGGLTGSPIAGALVTAENGGFLGLQLFCGATMICSALVYYAARWVQVGPSIRKVV